MKRMIILPLALAFSIAVQAQRNPARSTFSAGPVIGFGHAWMTPTAYSEYNPALTAGAFAIYSPIEHWGIGMDVLYSIEGSRKALPEVGRVDQDFHYLRVPVRAMYFFGNWGDDFRPKLTFGPSMGFLLQHNGPAYTSENRFDFGFTATGGFNYLIYDGAWLNADVGCYHGMSDAIQHTAQGERQRHIIASVGIGLEL